MRADPALKALAHPDRRAILALVWDAERASSDLADETGLSRPATSQHLRVLHDADLVTVRAEGSHRYYSARIETMRDLRAFLDGFWRDRTARLKDAAERIASADSGERT